MYPTGPMGIGGLGHEEIGGIGAVAFRYNPDLGPVGSGSAYWARDVEADAAALVFLGFMTDLVDANRAISKGSASQDFALKVGCFDPDFRDSVTDFQRSAGITADSFIGPNTRRAIAAAVAAKNAGGAAPRPAPPGQKPAAPPNVVPVDDGGEDNTLSYVAAGAGALAVGGLGWWILKNRKKHR